VSLLGRYADLLILATCLLWTIGVLAGLQRQQRFVIGFLVTACLAGALEAASNEFRWQMAPAYLFILLAAFRAAFDLSGRSGTPPKTWVKVAVRTLLVIVTLLVIAIPTMLFPRVIYRKPTGPYQVGVRSEFWIDSSRAETFTPDSGDHRKLLVEIWYPAEPGRDAIRATAHPDPDALAEAMAGALPGGYPSFLFKSAGTGLTWAWRDQPVSGAERSFPLLVFSHGFGGTRVQNGFEMAELASHGYIIASVEHSYTSMATRFPDGTSARPDTAAAFVLSADSTSVRIVNIWAADGRFVIDRLFALDRGDPRQMLSGRIDTTRVGYFGHSFGGATAAQVMSLDPRIVTGINMDGYLAGTAWINGLDRPFLQFRSDPIDFDTISEDLLKAAGTTKEAVKEIYRLWQERTVPVLKSGGMEIRIKGTAHNNYSDLPMMSPMLMRMAEQAGPIAPGRAHEIINAVTVAWFDRYLKGKAAPLLDNLAATYPEVEITARFSP
jgi:predicted dienelactone hydrolase